MAIQGSARVISREIDKSQVSPVEILPDGVPAAVVGTSQRGPAFVPVTFANMSQFGDVFGSINSKGQDSNSNKFGPLAVNSWMQNASAGTFIRVLGVGDGSAASNGVVEDAGFVVGVSNKQINPDSDKIEDNRYATLSTTSTGKTNALKTSRTYALGCLMKDSPDSDYLKDAGIDADATPKPVVRGLLMSPQGVVPALSQANSSYRSIDGGEDLNVMSNDTTFKNFVATAGLYGYQIGTVGTTRGTEDESQSFAVILNGFKNVDESNVIYCSFDPSSDNYFAKVMNTDPSKINEKGHFLYSWWDVEKSVAFPYGESNANDKAFLMHTSGALGGPVSTDLANMESFNARFRTAQSPWFISQAYGLSKTDDRPSTSDAAGCLKLFKVHALDDGDAGNDRFRVLISNLRLGVNSETYGSFDLTLEDFYSDPVNGVPLASWKNLSLDPDKSNYIARVIGDEHTFFDFDKPTNSQRMVTRGKFRVTNNYIRVEMDSSVEEKNIPANALPVGFKALSTPKFKNALHDFFGELGTDGSANNRLLTADFGADVAPIDMVKSISKVAGSGFVADQNLPWGVKFGSRKDGDKSKKETTEYSVNYAVKSWTKFYPDMGDNALVTQEDDYQNGYFTLEKIAYTTGTGIDWSKSEYIRSGLLTDKTNSGSDAFLDLQSDAVSTNIKFLKFRTVMQGGFDGVNIFDKEKSSLSNVAVFREANDETSTAVFSGPTVVAYKKALDVLSDKSLTELQLLAIPGIREPAVTNYAITACEDRFDAMFVMDIEEIGETSNAVITDLTDVPHVRNTITRFENRALDTSFAAAYFPDVVVRRPSTGSPLQVPPSVGILGTISLNDSLADPWFAPAGLTRGRLDAVNSKLILNRDLLNELYDADINPIYEPAGRRGEVYAFGQKTLLQDQSALDRINVRRLLINLRRRVKNIALNFLFEPNREATLSRFSAAVEPILVEMQARQGVDRYKVQIDTTTTTQNDVENNTIRGKIYIQPTKSIEFVSIDFTVTNSID